MPAEYGSLTAFLPPLNDQPADRARTPERQAAGRPAPPRVRTPGRWRSRRTPPSVDPPVAAPAPTYNGPARTWADPAPAGDGPAGRAGSATGPGAAPSPNGPVPSWAEPAPASGAAAPAARRARAPMADPAAPVARPGARPPRPGPSGPRSDGMAVVPVVVPADGREADGAPGASGPPSAGEPTPSDLLEVKRGRRRRRQWAQSSRTVRHLDVWTVAKVSFIFYLLLFGAVVVASVMLWYIANAVGSIQSIEKSIRTLFDLKTFTLHPSEVAAYTSAGGGCWPSLGPSATSWPHSCTT